VVAQGKVPAVVYWLTVELRQCSQCLPGAQRRRRSEEPLVLSFGEVDVSAHLIGFEPQVGRLG
jgi:hypothetical protein